MKIHKRIFIRDLSATFLIFCLIVSTACTSIVVRPVESTFPLQLICILDNPKVLVHDFVPVIRDALSRRGIRSVVFSEDLPEDCDAILTYTAFRHWDFSAYLNHAEVRLERDGLPLGYAEYHLRGNGGLSFFKWRSTRKKMDPVLDELLANVGQ